MSDKNNTESKPTKKPVPPKKPKPNNLIVRKIDQESKKKAPKKPTANSVDVFSSDNPDDEV